MRQLGFGVVDLKLHREYDPARDGDVLAYARDVLTAFTPVELPADYGMIASFSHLFPARLRMALVTIPINGQKCWTRMLSRGSGAKVFSIRKRVPTMLGTFSSGATERIRRNLPKFMGRDPDSNALLERAGLIAA